MSGEKSPFSIHPHVVRWDNYTKELQFSRVSPTSVNIHLLCKLHVNTYPYITFMLIMTWILIGVDLPRSTLRIHINPVQY